MIIVTVLYVNLMVLDTLIVLRQQWRPCVGRGEKWFVCKACNWKNAGWQSGIYYVGNTFIVSMAHADSVILLCPTV